MPPLKDATSGTAVLVHSTGSGTGAGGTAGGAPVFEYVTLEQQAVAINDWHASITANQTALDDAEAARNQQVIDYIDAVNLNLGKSQGRGRLVVLFTANNVPSVFYRMPAMTCEQLAPDGSLGTGMHPAFLENGVQAKALYISAFANSNVAGEAVSLPFAEPWTDISRDAAIAACAATDYPAFPGKNRLMSVWDRAAAVHEASQLGVNPAMNSAFGADHNDPSIVGEASAVAGRMLTGSMGAAANHNGLPDGIADLAGNVWQWLSGFELSEGQILMNPDNDDPANIAALTPMAEYFSSSNPALTAGFSVPSITDAASQQKNSGSAYDHIAGASGFSSVAGGSESLKRAAIASTVNSRAGALWARSYGSCAPICGGSLASGHSGGLSALNLIYSSSLASSNFGFRSAFVA